MGLAALGVVNIWFLPRRVNITVSYSTRCFGRIVSVISNHAPPDMLGQELSRTRYRECQTSLKRRNFTMVLDDKLHKEAYFVDR